MHILVSAIHLFAGQVWAAGLLAAVSGLAGASRFSRHWGPVLVVTGLLLAIGSIQHNPSKSVLGLYGLAVLLALFLFSALIALARRHVEAGSRSRRLPLLGGLAALSLLMVVMAHWPA